MKLLLLLTLCCAAAQAQTLAFSIHDNSGTTPDTPLPAAYQFASTPEGGSTSILVKATNSGSNPIEVALVYIGAEPATSTATPNFTITGLDQGHILAPAASQYFTINFTPGTTGQLLGYLQVAYLVQQNSCSFNSSPTAARCSGGTAPVSTLEGTGTAPQLLLTYNTGGGDTMLFPSTTGRLDFGSVATSATSAIPFTLANQTSAPVATPRVALQTDVFGSSAFAIDTSALPATIPPNGAAKFTVTFAPGQLGLTTSTLAVGTNTYGIEGTGIVVNSTDALQIAYVDATGVRTLPQAASPISFGQLVPGTAGGATLNFTVTNPATSFSAVTLSALSVSGSAFSLTGAPTLPATIQPNASVTFSVTFSAKASGKFSGTLTIGTRTFTLSGLSVVSPVPTLSMQLSQQPLTSAQLVNLTIQASSAAEQSAIGQLTMQFTPSVANVSDDPAVVFLATNGRSLQLTLPAGSTNATYQGQSALAFQTGSTAGTVTFTLTFPNTSPLTQTFAITPAQIHITGAQAIRQVPNLVVTVNGYDNTYTAGQLSFTFFDAKGTQINSSPMSIDASSNFHQYFFTDDPAGGSFAMQASFPVTGDATLIGAVAVTLTNSAGQTTTKLTFQ